MELNLDLVEIRKSILSQASRQCLPGKTLEKHVLCWDKGVIMTCCYCVVYKGDRSTFAKSVAGAAKDGVVAHIQDRLLALGCGTRSSLLRVRSLGTSWRLVLLNGPMSVLRR